MKPRTKIHPDELAAFIRLFGFDPSTVHTMTIERDRVTVWEYALNADGARYCHPAGNVALEPRGIPVVADR